MVVLGGCGIQAGDNEDAAFTVRLIWGDIGPSEDSAMGRQGSDYVFREPTGRYGG